MPEYLSPGVYIEEVASGARPIEGVGTAMAAFVGFAPAGPANTPMLITNWAQYVDTFGSLEEGGQRNPHLSGAYLSHSVYGYFLNGGGRCYVARVVSKNDAKRASLAAGELVLTAVGRGLWGNRVFVLVKPSTKAEWDQLLTAEQYEEFLRQGGH